MTDCVTVYAYTPAEPSPPYLNVSRVGQEYHVTVRSPARMVGETAVLGDIAQILLHRDELIELSRALGREH